MDFRNFPRARRYIVTRPFNTRVYGRGGGVGGSIPEAKKSERKIITLYTKDIIRRSVSDGPVRGTRCLRPVSFRSAENAQNQKYAPGEIFPATHGNELSAH